MPVYDELIFVAHKDRVGDDRLNRFMAAIERAIIWTTNHPEQGWELFKAAHPDLDNELNRRAWADTMPRFAKRPAALDEARYRRFAEFMKAQGLIEDVVPVSQYATVLR